MHQPNRDKAASICPWRSRVAPEFVDLGRIEVQTEIVQHSPSELTLRLERVGINMPSLAAGQ